MQKRLGISVDERLVIELKSQAAKNRTTVSELVELACKTFYPEYKSIEVVRRGMSPLDMISTRGRMVRSREAKSPLEMI